MKTSPKTNKPTASQSKNAVVDESRKAATRESSASANETAKLGKSRRGAEEAAALGGDSKKRSPHVMVRWQQIEGTTHDIEQAARDVAETVVGHIQRQRQGDEVVTVRPDAAPSSVWETGQAGSPIGYQEAQARLAGVQWQAVDGGTLLLITESGEILQRNSRARRARGASNGEMSEVAPERRPLKINVRPGQGGLQRRPLLSDEDEELRSLGEVIWRTVPGGAMLGVLELSSEGNAAIVARLSGEDKSESLYAQVRNCLALANHFPDRLRPRLAILGKNLSGTDVREVRHPRAGSPPPGVLERDDILLVDEFIEAGWLEHVIFHEATRIARHPLPGEMIFERLTRNDVGLWIAWYGKQIDWAEDGDRLRNDMVFSKRDRDNIVRKLQTARANKGPLAGNGHLGPTKLGVVRDRRTHRRSEDPEQMYWINRAFEIADLGLASDESGLSVRRVQEILAEEGFEISYEKLRLILRDPLYATGENTTRLRGVVIEQEPIRFENPVPLDRFQRVQEALELRQGSSRETPIGEYLFNYVDTRHLQCLDETNAKGQVPRLKGWVLDSKRKELKGRRLRHAYFTPEQCKRGGRGRGGCFTWERDELEAPVVREIRKLASHPEILRQIAAATRHTIAPSEIRLTDGERAELERQIAQLELDKQTATDQWVLGMAGGRKLAESEKSFENYQRFIETYDRQSAQRQRRLERDRAAMTAEQDGPAGRGIDPRQGDRANAFLEIMTVETPSDPLLRQLRARLFQRIVSRVIIDDDGEGPITITLEGHLVPEEAGVGEANLVLAGADLLDAYLDRQNGRTPKAEAMTEAAEGEGEVAGKEVGKGAEANGGAAIADECPSLETDQSATTEKSVSRLFSDYEKRPTTNALKQARRQRLDAVDWRLRRGHSARFGEPSWVVIVKVP